MQNSTSLPADWIDRIFLILHGRFGNTFTNKFKLGQLNADGIDAGIANAKTVWAQNLGGISGERIKAALDAAYEHAPSCDAFKAQCVAVRKVQDYKAIATPTDYETSRHFADNVVQFVAKNITDKTDYKQWARTIVNNPDRYPAESLAAAKEALSA